MSYVFPTRLLNPGTINARIVGANQSGGRSLSGLVQNAELTGGGYWVIEFGKITLWTREKMMAWRRLSAALSGGATSVLVPIADRAHQPLNVVPYSGADTFGLNTWEDDDIWNAEAGDIAATFSGTQAVRATTIDFGYSGGQPLLGGEHFSVQTGDSPNDTRLHRITRVISLVSTTYTAEIRPPLRHEYTGGTPMNFNSPRAQMRLDGDMEATLEMLKFGAGSVRFIEDFPPSSVGTG